MKKENSHIRIISLLLVFTMVFTLSSCGKDAASSGMQSAGDGNQSGTVDQTQEESGSKETAMGRYVETEIDLSDQLSNIIAFCKREDGSLVILDRNLGFFISQDKGDTWTMETPDWLVSMEEKGCYVYKAAIAPDGTVGVIYDPIRDDVHTYVMDLILPDGENVPVEIPLTENEGDINQVVMTKDNRIFVRTEWGNLYEVYKDGSGELLPLTKEYSPTFYREENLLIRDVSWKSAFVLYDMDAGQEIEDEVFSEFVNENYNDREYVINAEVTRECSMYILQDSDSVLYLIGDKGIHRHVVGGNMMEQVVDGKLSMLSNPSYIVVSALMLDEDEFIVLFSNFRLLRFAYDPNVPTVPEDVLTIYSLREDEDMQQAVTMYQSRHPDIFVSYKIGMTDGDAVTRDDALKKLNTEIIAGTGPDLIMLDELPFDSYVEKGLLLDLTDYLREYSEKEPLYDNIIDALKVDGKAYAVPATFHIPILIGRKDILSGIKDLDSLGEAVEMLRNEHPGDDIIGIYDAEGIMNRFAAVSAPKWVTESGIPNRENIGNYLKQCKRIYDAQMDGIRASILEPYRGGVYIDKLSAWMTATGFIEYLNGKQYLLSGWLETPHSYNQCISLEKAEGCEDSGFTDMQGECAHVFRPNTLLGISSVSTQPDAAKEFMDFFLSAEAQGNYYSFPVNKAAYERQAAVNETWILEDGSYLYMGHTLEDDNGKVFTPFIVYLASEKQTAALQERFAALDTPYIQDSVLEDAVSDNGSAYIRGEATLEEALNRIEGQVSIYMAE